ncbi:MAG: GNAT family N-acetyltransferase [Butyrivibrio sp.]|nr:GNAT family N-acetyltransferase [Butyrivibrio sp.]
METIIINPDEAHPFKPFIDPAIYPLLNEDLQLMALGLLEDSRPVGAAIGITDNYNDFNVLSIYVDPQFRRKGGGNMLIQGLEESLEFQNSGPAMLSFIEGKSSDNEAFFKFAEAIGIYEASDFERLYAVPLSSFYESDLFSGKYDSNNIRQISKINVKEDDAFWSKYISTDSTVQSHMLGNLRSNPEFSFVFTQKGEVLGYLLLGYSKRFHKKPLIKLSSFSAPNVTSALLGTFLSMSRNAISPDTTVLIPAPDDRYETMLGRLKGARNLQHNYIL